MRFYADHIATDTNVEYRIEIHDSQFGGSAQKMKGIGSGWLDFSHQKLDPKKPHLNPIQKGSLKVGLWIRNASEQTLLSDILSSDEQRFTIKYIVDSVEEWEGFVLPDLVRYTEDENPKLTLEAKDFTTLEGVNAPAADVTAYRRLSVLIADCLKLGGLTLPIRSYTNLTHADVTQANDFLHEIYHRREAFETKGGMISCMDALENICRAYNLTIKQSGKRWVIDQLPGVAKGDTTQYDYDSDGLNPTSSTPDRGYTPTKVTIRSDNRRIAALKSLDSVYNHRTLIHNIETEDVTYTFDPAPTYDQFSLSFENTPIYRMYFSTEVEVDADTAQGIEGSAFLTVKGIASAGFSDQYLTNAGSWSAVQQDIEITMSGPDGSMSGSFEVKDSGNIADAVEEIVITLKWADASLVGGAAQTVTEVRWLNTQAYIFHSSIQDIGASIRYRYIRSGNYSVSEDIGMTVLGDGPTFGTNSASKGRPASGSLASTVLEPNRFRIRGVSESVKLEELKLREYINVRRSGVRILSADVIGTFSSESILNYDNENWYVLGDSVDGYTGRHRSEIMALSYDGDTTGDIFTEIVESGGDPTGTGTGISTPGTGGGSGLSESDADDLYFRQDNQLSEVSDSDLTPINSQLTETDITESGFSVTFDREIDHEDAIQLRSNISVLGEGTLGSQIRTNSQLDGRYGRLTAANTWTRENSFFNGVNSEPAVRMRVADSVGDLSNIMSFRNAAGYVDGASRWSFVQYFETGATPRIYYMRASTGIMRFDADEIASASVLVGSSHTNRSTVINSDRDYFGRDGNFSRNVTIDSGLLDITAVGGASAQDAIRASVSDSNAVGEISIGYTQNHHAMTADVWSDFTNASFRTRRARGNKSTPAAVQSDDFLGSYTGNGYNGLQFPGSSVGALIFRADGDFSDGDHPTRLDIMTTGVGEANKRTVGSFLESGQFEIGMKVNADMKFSRDGSGSHRIFKDGHFLRFLADDGSIVFELRNSTVGSNEVRVPNNFKFEGGLLSGDSSVLINSNKDFFARDIELSRDIEKDNFALTTDFSGTGWKGTTDGDFNIRNLVVREAARFRHLIIDELGIIAGSDLRSIARGKIESINSGNNTVVLENPRGISATSWVANDFFWVKAVDIDGNTFLDLKGQVTGVDTTGGVITLTLDTTVAGGTHDGGTTDISNLSPGNVLVQRGHPTNADRQSLIYTTVSDSDNPVQKYFTGIDSLAAFDNQANVRAFIGNLDNAPNATGFGFHSTNAFLTGSLLAGDLTKANNYLEYDSGVLTVNGTIVVQGGSGIGSFTDAGGLATEDSVDYDTQVGGAEKPENNATVGADWDTNLSNLPGRLSVDTGNPSSSGLYLTSQFLGYWNNGATNWDVFIGNDGKFGFNGDANNFITWDGLDFEIQAENFNFQAGNDFWRTSDNTGSLGSGIITWNGGSGVASIAGFSLTGTQIESDNLSGGSNGNFTTAGIVLNKDGWLSSPEFALGTTVSKIADFNFEIDSGVGHFYREDASNNFVGLQSASANDTKAIFAGATDKAGTNANFSVTNEGKIFHPSINNVFFSREELASFSDNAQASSLTDESWSSQVSRSTNGTSSREDVKLRTSFLKRFGADRLVISGYYRARSQALSDAPAFGEDITHVTELVVTVTNQETSAAVSDRTSLTNENFTPFEIDFDISGVNDDDKILVELAIYVEVTIADSEGTNQVARLEVREDLVIQNTV